MTGNTSISYILIDKNLVIIVLEVTQKCHNVPMMNRWKITYLLGIIKLKNIEVSIELEATMKNQLSCGKKQSSSSYVQKMLFR